MAKIRSSKLGLKGKAVGRASHFRTGLVPTSTHTLWHGALHARLKGRSGIIASLIRRDIKGKQDTPDAWVQYGFASSRRHETNWRRSKWPKCILRPSIFWSSLSNTNGGELPTGRKPETSTKSFQCATNTDRQTTTAIRKRPVDDVQFS